MRTFLVIAHRFSGYVNLKDLPGSGRIDVITRCINASVFLSHAIRQNVNFLVFFPHLQARLKIDSRRVRYLNPDERSIAGLIKKAMEKIKDYEMESTPGFFIKRSSFREVIDEITDMGKLFYLREDGKDIREVDIPTDSSFVLGDQADLTEEEEKVLLQYEPEIVKVSPRSLLSSHVIVIVHNELDRRGL